MKIKSFRIGGIHPDEHTLSNDAVTQPTPLPKQAVFPMSQHIGAPAKPIVKKGDKTKMKIFLILYIIGIIIYWLGILNFVSVAKRNWDNIDESLKDNARERSKASCRLTLIVWSLTPVVNFLMGFLYISDPFYFLKK